MSYFEDVYKKRLNRYGLNYQERVLTQRREVFSRRLLKSVYRIQFWYDQQEYAGTFERFKQDNTQVLRYLLTEYDLIIPNGTVLMLPDPIERSEPEYTDEPVYDIPAQPRPIVEENDKYEKERPWLVFYLEDTGAKGYNRYVMLRLTHYLTWLDRDKVERSSYAYMYGQEDNMLKDEIRSRSRMNAVYGENLKSSFFVMPATEHLRKGDYFVIDKDINNKVLDEYYRVTGVDIQSQDNVEYVTVDPVYEYSEDYFDDVKREELVQEPEETAEDFQKRVEEDDAAHFWLMDQFEEE